MCDILNIVQKERKICYFLGDLNIDILKCGKSQAHGDISREFIHICFSTNNETHQDNKWIRYLLRMPPIVGISRQFCNEIIPCKKKNSRLINC